MISDNFHSRYENMTNSYDDRELDYVVDNTDNSRDTVIEVLEAYYYYSGGNSWQDISNSSDYSEDVIRTILECRESYSKSGDD